MNSSIGHNRPNIKLNGSTDDSSNSNEDDEEETEIKPSTHLLTNGIRAVSNGHNVVNSNGHTRYHQTKDTTEIDETARLDFDNFQPLNLDLSYPFQPATGHHETNGEPLKVVTKFAQSSRSSHPTFTQQALARSSMDEIRMNSKEEVSPHTSESPNNSLQDESSPFESNQASVENISERSFRIRQGEASSADGDVRVPSPDFSTSDGFELFPNMNQFSLEPLTLPSWESLAASQEPIQSDQVTSISKVQLKHETISNEHDRKSNGITILPADHHTNSYNFYNKLDSDRNNNIEDYSDA